MHIPAWIETNPLLRRNVMASPDRNKILAMHVEKSLGIARIVCVLLSIYQHTNCFVVIGFLRIQQLITRNKCSHNDIYDQKFHVSFLSLRFEEDKRNLLPSTQPVYL